MTCHCGKTALYIAGRKGFCGEHKDEAVARMSHHTSSNMVQDRRDRGQCIQCAVPCEGTLCSLHRRINSAASLKTYHKRKTKT